MTYALLTIFSFQTPGDDGSTRTNILHAWAEDSSVVSVLFQKKRIVDQRYNLDAEHDQISNIVGLNKICSYLSTFEYIRVARFY